MKNKSYLIKKKREDQRYRIAREHWKKFDTAVLKEKYADIIFQSYDYISSQAIRDEIESREVKK